VRADLVAARRRAEVREAAADWERAGIIDPAARAAIDSRYGDDRVSRPVVWRVLIFVFVWVIASAGSGIVFATLRPSDEGVGILLLLLAGVFAGATEHLQGSRRFDGAGAEAAASFLAATSALGGFAFLLLRHDAEARFGVVLLISALIWGAAWQRWGFALYALFGGISLFFGAGMSVGAPRIAWLVLAAATLFLWTGRPGDFGRSWLAAVGLAGAYACLNVWSYDHGVIERLRAGAPPAVPHFPGARFLAAAATALFPIVLLASGVARRRRLLIDAGLASAALSLVTLRAYVRLGPLWLVLAEAGAASIVLALSAERLLDSGEGRERRGFTADALFEDARSVRALSAAATVLALSPDATTAPAANELTPGGGSYGGAGASGEF